MTSTTPDALAATLERLNLLTPEALEGVRESEGLPTADVLDALAEAGHLTRFQAQAIGRDMADQLVVSDYVILDALGAGTIGTAYKARSTTDGALFAVKLVPRRNVINLKALAAKVELLKQVRHPRVSALVHVGTTREHAFAAYPFLDGGEKLDAMVARLGRLAPRQAAQIALQVASGLQAYHEHGLFHGLLKPNEVVIGSDRRVRLLDFGVGFLLACERGKSLLDTSTNSKAMARGLDCASPESILDPLDRSPAGDQYALGCVLYYAIAGQFPFPDENPVKKMLGHQFEAPTPLRRLVPDVPAELNEIVMRMLAKTPAGRYAKVGEVVERLQLLTADSRKFSARAERPAVTPKPATKPPPAPAPEPVPPANTPWAMALGLAAGVGAAAAFGMWWLRG